MSGGGNGAVKNGMYDALRDKIDYRKNPLYQKLNSDHAKAHHAALKELNLSDTTGMDENKIIEHMAKYMIAFDQRNGKATKELSDVRKKEYIGKAKEFLDTYAKSKEIRPEDLMNILYQNGIDSVLEAYRDNERDTTKSRLHRVHVHETLGSLDYDRRLALAKELKERVQGLEDAEPGEIVPGLEGILLRDMSNFHERTVEKHKKEKKKKKAA